MDIQTGVVSQSLVDQLFFIAITLFVLVILFACLAVVLFLLVVYVKKGRREKKSLEFELLQVRVPKDNEVKIDAMEQFFASISSIGHGSHGFMSMLKMEFLNIPDHVSFEIVGTPGDIRFYVSCHHHLRDLIEKQIYGMYPGADIKEVDEYNIFDIPRSSYNLKGHVIRNV
jgi:hypothetical protein